ncbi:hypothetical protein BDQ12DRAFT_614995 [Crucibulum laeve]|uniref:Acetyl-CoA synthetase-like protein n=1 Tax=Crucibulum laeve TaxID=68775 RepID=A0A5C3LL63_9AGAR|nr:hypothetical protein BDQ12DRAFT_614995 [Crucibulum laeve]
MVTIYALQKCGITPLLLSIRNSHAAIVNLLRVTNSVAILADSYYTDTAQAASAEFGSIPVYNLAPLPGPITEPPKPFPFSLKYADECDNPIVILHTSGSTGLPKPVAWSSRFFWNQTYYPDSYVAKYFGSSILSVLPLFHGSGVGLVRSALVWLGWRVILPDSSRPVTASAVIELCNTPGLSPDIVYGPPSVIEEIPTLPGGWDAMRGRRNWVFVGAAISPHFGDLLVEKGIHFTPGLGSTEIGQIGLHEPEGQAPEDWNYHEIRPDLNYVLESRGLTPESGPFELIVLAKDGWAPGIINVQFDGIGGYATSDLYEKHPVNPHWLKHCGRLDDVIVLSNGEKTLSRAIEIPIEADPRVQCAIVFGTGRVQNGVLIVPSSQYTFDPSDSEKLTEYRDAIWPSVEIANSTSPMHSRIWKEMLLITSPHKELPRTDKGSIKRKPALELYQAEIDELYKAADSQSLSNRGPLPPTLDVANLVFFFQGLIEECMGRRLSPDEDVFDNGMGSLKAIFIRNSLLTAFKREPRLTGLVAKIPQNFVYTHSSATAMAEAIYRLTSQSTSELVTVGQETPEEHASMITSMVEKYTAIFAEHVPRVAEATENDGEVVILTGSTGSLGTYILDSLVSDSSVSKIYAFNRKGSSLTEHRQMRSYAQRELDSLRLLEAVATGRVVYHDVELQKPNLGLPWEAYDEISSSATLIIHNAWALNFNWTLDTYETVHVKGVRNLVNFALLSPRAEPPRIVFTSSIATVGGYSSGPALEVPIEDPAVCMPHGYARSKFVAERILSIASEKTPLQTTSFRLGQIAGDSVHGVWNETDSIPVLLKGSQKLGALPTDWLSEIAWTPADVVAQAIIDVSLHKTAERGTSIFHINNPRPTSWSDLVPFVQSSLATRDGSPLELITMAEWVDRLKATTQSAEENPAIKLIEFFENSLRGNGVRCTLDLQKIKEASPTLRNARPIDEQIFGLFLDYWRKIQFLES